MKVLIYTEYFPPIPGGVQTIVVELARGLAAWKGQKQDPEVIEVKVVTQTAGRQGEDDSQPFRVIRRPGFRGLLRLLREADVVHLAGPAMMPLALGLLLGKPVVVEHHGFQVACPNGLLFFEPTQSPCPGHFMAGRYNKCLECNRHNEGAIKSLYWLFLGHVRRWLSNRAAVNITPTDWLATVLDLRRMSTVHHGISPPTAANAAKPSPSCFAFQGRLVTAKGLDLFLRAAEQLRRENYDFRLKIVGDGSHLETIRSQVPSELAGRIEILGHVPDDRLDQVLEDVATVVMPSLGGEVFGLVAAENMLRGKLLIVSDIGALREVVADTGLVFPTGDVEGLAACMRQVLKEPSLAASLGSAARTRAMQVFNRHSMIQHHLSLYREALLR
jgi:glycosyltransferase involved in cell wall biosynthesis